MVAAELAQQASIEAAAQSVVDRVKRLHHDVYVSGRQRAVYCSRHEDMTLLIRSINYPLADGALTPTQGTKQNNIILIHISNQLLQNIVMNSSYFLFRKCPELPSVLSHQACCLVNNRPLVLFLSSAQVAVSTQFQCPTPTAKAPVKPVWPSHWSCPPKVLSPMEPTQPPHWRKALPLLGKFAFSFYACSALPTSE